MSQKSAQKIAKSILGKFNSKWLDRYYRYDNPKNSVLNQIQIMMPDHGTIWWGSIDLTKNSKKLIQLSKKLNSSLLISDEYNGRHLYNCNNSDEPIYNAIIANTEYGIFWMINMNEHHDWYVKNNTPYCYTQLEWDRMQKVDEYEYQIFKNELKNRFKKIKLPPIKKFKGSKNGNVSPWEQLKNYFLKKHGAKRGENIWRDLYLSKQGRDIIHENSKNFFHKNSPLSHPLIISDSAEWDFARHGCRFFYFDEKDNNINYGYIYKPKKWLPKRKKEGILK